MFFNPPLDFVEQIPELHANDQGGHGQEYVAPDEHVKMMNEIQQKDGQFEDEFGVISEGTAFFPNRAGPAVPLPRVV